MFQVVCRGEVKFQHEDFSECECWLAEQIFNPFYDLEGFEIIDTNEEEAAS